MLDEDFYRRLAGRVACFAAGLTDAFNSSGLGWRVPVVATLSGVFAGTELPDNYAEATACDEDGYARFFHGMLRRGVAMAPGAYEVMFCGMAHTDALLDRVIEAAAESAAEVAAGTARLPGE
jgi:glutamate-1-semialdehyde 2,1-aminomutase